MLKSQDNSLVATDTEENVKNTIMWIKKLKLLIHLISYNNYIRIHKIYNNSNIYRK